MKRVHIGNVAVGVMALLLVGSVLSLFGGWGQLLAAPNDVVPAHSLRSESAIQMSCRARSCGPMMTGSTFCGAGAGIQ